MIYFYFYCCEQFGAVDLKPDRRGSYPIIVGHGWHFHLRFEQCTFVRRFFVFLVRAAFSRSLAQFISHLPSSVLALSLNYGNRPTHRVERLAIDDLACR
jgi:hypothetical protein